MADEAVTTQQAAPEAVEQTTEQAQPDATGEVKAERVFSQSELEAIVKDRIEREKRKSAEAADKARIEAERKAAEESGQFQKLAESLKAELEAERAARKAAELASMRREVASRHNLPAGLADRLRGDTAEELDADAKALIASLPKPPAPDINAGTASGKAKPSVFDGMDIDNLAARLGVSAKYAREYLNGGN